MEDLDLSIALRRRSSPSLNVRSEERQTPSTRRRKRSVRHSDQGSTAQSSGLITPMVQRASFTTASSGPSAAVNVHQTIDGRVERRTRRSSLRDVLKNLNDEKQRNEQLAKAQITKLKAELRARDREIYRLQNATMVSDTERIWDLEQQIKELKGQLATKSTGDEETSQYFSCVWPSTSSTASTEDLMEVAREEDYLGDVATGPSCLTPPATSPTMSTSPFSKDASPMADARAPTQLNSPDQYKKRLEEEVASLEFQVQKLTRALDTYNAWGLRISEALLNGTLKERGALSCPEAVENHIQFLVQTMSERAAAATHLTAAIAELGFPGADAGEMIMSLASGFRAARLELEHLAPGEITLPLTACGADTLDLLLDRLRMLSRKTSEDEDSMDEYHEIERSLRKQLDSQTCVMEKLNIEIAEAHRALNEKDSRIRELEVRNDRLKGAVDGARHDRTRGIDGSYGE